MAEICQNWYICSFRANVVGCPIILQPRDHHHWLQHEKRVQKRFFHHLFSQNGTFLDHTSISSGQEFTILKSVLLTSSLQKYEGLDLSDFRSSYPYAMVLINRGNKHLRFR